MSQKLHTTLTTHYEQIPSSSRAARWMQTVALLTRRQVGGQQQQQRYQITEHMAELGLTSDDTWYKLTFCESDELRRTISVFSDALAAVSFTSSLTGLAKESLLGRSLGTNFSAAAFGSG